MKCTNKTKASFFYPVEWNKSLLYEAPRSMSLDQFIGVTRLKKCRSAIKKLWSISVAELMHLCLKFSALSWQ